MVKWWRIIGFFMIFYSVTVFFRGLDYQFRISGEFIGRIIDILIPLGIGIFAVLKPDFFSNAFKRFKSGTATKKRK